MRKFRKYISALLIAGFMLPNVFVGNVEAANAVASADTTLSAVSSEASADTAADEQAYVPGEAIVCFRTGDIPDSLPAQQVKRKVENSLEKESIIDDAEALLALEDADDVEEVVEEADATDKTADADPDPAMITLVHSDTLTTDELLAELRGRDDVLYAEPNYITEIQPGDYSDRQWSADTTYGIGVEGWNTYDGTTPTPKVDASGQVVAIIDTGVDYNHEDLKDSMWSDGLNYPSLVAMGGGAYGYNGCYGEDTTDPMDEHGHGTACSGVMVATWNQFGVSGVACGAKVMALKGIPHDVDIFQQDAVVRCYQYIMEAKRVGVNVVAVNNSYGWSIQSMTDMILIQEAGKLGIVCVYAAGNDSYDVTLSNDTTVIDGRPSNGLVVGSSDVNGKPAWYSNYGVKDVDVYAPGDDIWSTGLEGNEYPDESSPTLTVDGKTYDLDYSERDTAEESVFGLEVDEDQDVSIRTAGDGKNVLHIEEKQDITPADNSIDISTMVLPDITDAKGACLELYSEQAKSVLIRLAETDGDWDGQIYFKTTSLKAGLNRIGIVYPTNPEKYRKKNVRLKLELYFGAKKQRNMDLRSFRLCSALPLYGVNSGTSLASPIVVGAVAVLAAYYPEDSAAKRAARVTGSVMKTDEMADRCISGGIFRLDKALAGETVPVPRKAGTDGNANTFTVEGFFFGDSAGTITLNGKACTVKSWSDEKITAELPEEFTPGEALIRITSPKGTGRGYLSLGKPAGLYPRLPLPGSTVSETGEYTISEAAKEEYRDFYTGTVRSMIGMDDALYIFLAGVNGGTTVYRYQIKEKKWESLVTSMDYAATDGIAGWNGKILITANNEDEHSTAIGIYDPKRNELTWKLTNPDYYEYNVRMVNNGYGIFLLGGQGFDGKHLLTFLNVRTLDTTTMEITDPDTSETRLNEMRPVAAAAEDGTIYAFSGTDYGYFYGYLTFSMEGSTFKERKKIYIEQDQFDFITGTGNMVDGVATKNGLLLFGSLIADESQVVVKDSFLLSYDGKTATRQERILSQRPVRSPVAASWDGICYVIGGSDDDEGNNIFACIEADALPQYGVKAHSDEWEDGIYYGKDGFRSLEQPYKYSWKNTKKGKMYIDSQGNTLKSRWARIDGVRYYFKADGCMARDEYVAGRKFNEDGTHTYPYKYHWRTTKLGKRFVDSQGNYLKSQWAVIDGTRYYFKADGCMACDEFVSGRKFNKDGTQTYPYKYHWRTTGKGRRFMDSRGNYLKKRWAVIDGKSYYFRSDGYMASYEWIKGKWFNKDGLQKRKYKGSWEKTPKGRRYVDTSGWYAKNRTLRIDGKKYKFDKKGYVVR